MDPKVIDTLRHVFVLAVLLAIGIFGYKQYKKYDARKQVVSAMRADISDVNFYRALRESDAQATFLRCIGRVQRAQQLGMEQNDFMNAVFDRKKDSDAGIEETLDGTPTKEKLVRICVKSGWQTAKLLNMFDEPDAVSTLLTGEMPIMSPAPVLSHIVDPALSPGLEKVVPNFELLPEARKPNALPTDIEVNATRQLINDLADAGIIDHYAQKRIIDDYEAARSKRSAPAPVAVPAPQ
jgi:Tfp pilus assembly major pilin PilA